MSHPQRPEHHFFRHCYLCKNKVGDIGISVMCGWAGVGSPAHLVMGCEVYEYLSPIQFICFTIIKYEKSKKADMTEDL